jgi:hypothetical protein
VRKNRFGLKRKKGWNLKGFKKRGVTKMNEDFDSCFQYVSGDFEQPND